MDEKLLLEFNTSYPLVKLFFYKKKFFAFDGKSSCLTQITIKDIKMLLKIAKNNDFRQDALGDFYGLLSNGVFLPGSLRSITPEKKDVEKNIKYNFDNVIPRKFIIEVTQECTLRCKYCYYSKNNENRVHAKTNMTHEIAKAAIDMYFKTYTNALQDLSSEKRTRVIKIAVPTLSWWGGEPFLNFELIKWTKEYFESLPWENYGITLNDLVYSVVTNLTLINSEIIDFLVNNNVYTFISIDGDKIQHNTNRIFPNGKGSYDVVESNLELLLGNNPEFCKKYVCLQAVQADNIDTIAAAKFINDTFKDKVINCQFLTQSYWNGEQKKKNKPIETFDFIFYENLYHTFDNLSSDEFYRMLSDNNNYYDLFKGIFEFENAISLDSPRGSNNFYRTFSCPIGIDVIFVAADGHLHMCNKSDYSYPLGDVSQGIDVNELKELYMKYYAAFCEQCKACWAFNFCKVCPATSMVNKTFRTKDIDMCRMSRFWLFDVVYSYIILQKYPKVYSLARKYYKEKLSKQSFLSNEGATYKNEY